LLKGEHIDLRTFVEIMEILKVEKPPTLMDSQAKYAAIAAGQADLLIRCPAKRVSATHSRITRPARSSLRKQADE